MMDPVVLRDWLSSCCHGVALPPLRDGSRRRERDRSREAEPADERGDQSGLLTQEVGARGHQAPWVPIGPQLGTPSRTPWILSIY